MTTNIALILCGLAIALQPPAKPVEADVSQSKTGHVLILENERTLEGDIERLGNQYRVRRAQGELWVPADTAIQLCESYQAAYVYLKKCANLRDPDERLRLAHWCHAHNLREQAIQEAKQAVELRPEHTISRRLLANLERTAGPRETATLAKVNPEVESSQAAPPVSSDSLGLFVTKVQPLLMNACAGCHATGRGGAFKLTRVFSTDLNNRRTMQMNLAAVVQQLNREKPLVSPLLIKAVSVHGDVVQPPLKGREAPAYRTLEDWVRLTLQDAPQTLDAGVVASATPIENSPSKSATTEGFASAQTASESAPAVQAGATKPATPKSKTEPADAYDPSIFNRQMHPEKSADSDKR
jgi:hypothetical protein